MQAGRGYWDTLADPYYVRQRVQQCESLGRAPDVLYLGSSRALYTVNPARIDDTLAAQQGARTLGCNAGQFASTFEQDYYTLQRVLRDGYTPKLVVEVLWEWNLNANAAVPADSDPFHFNQVLQLAQAPDTSRILERMGGLPNGIPDALDFLAGQLLPLYGDRTALLQKLCNGSQVGPCGVYTSPMDPGLVHLYQTSTRQGWVGNGSAPLGRLSPDEQLTRLDGLTPFLVGTLQRFAIGGHQPDWLAKMIALAKAHGVRFVMLQTPLSPEYYQLFPHQDDWQHVTDFWASFAAAHGVPYYDESHLAGYTEADFVDLHHLQAVGADRFSAWLATNVVGPTLAGKP
jgi:hypothetical protein